MCKCWECLKKRTKTMPNTMSSKQKTTIWSTSYANHALIRLYPITSEKFIAVIAASFLDTPVTKANMNLRMGIT